MKSEHVIVFKFDIYSWMLYSSEQYYGDVTFAWTTTTVELLIWCQCYSNKIIITAWSYRLGNLILLVILMIQAFNFCEVYSITILRLCSFTLCRVFLLTKCFVIGEKWLWNVLLDCFQLPGKSVFSEHKHAGNVAPWWCNWKYIVCCQSLKLKFSQYLSIHTNYIIPRCTTLQYNHNIWHGT